MSEDELGPPALTPYQELVQKCILMGHRGEPRGKACHQLWNVTVYEDDPNWFTKPIAMAELLAIVCGWDDVEWLKPYAPSIGQFSDDSKTFAGAYGPRLAFQWHAAAELLRKDPETRRCVLTIYEEEDLGRVSKDIPCNVTLCFWTSPAKELCLTIFQRSSDLIWGLPVDTYVFSEILRMMAAEIGVDTGFVCRNIVNAHVYVPGVFYSEERIQEVFITQPKTVHLPIEGIRQFREWATQVRKAGTRMEELIEAYTR